MDNNLSYEIKLWPWLKKEQYFQIEEYFITKDKLLIVVKTNKQTNKLCVLMGVLALENWKRWAVTGTDLSLSLAERDDRGALRSTVSGGWMATQSFKNTERRYNISKHFYMRVCILECLKCVKYPWTISSLISPVTLHLQFQQLKMVLF